MKQRWLLSRGSQAKIARKTWVDSTLEKTIVKVLMEGLTACRIPVFRINAPIPNCQRCHASTGPPNTAGIPDLIGWVPPSILSKWRCSFNGAEHYSPIARPLFIEVKRPTRGVESAVQKEFIERAKKTGAIAFFCRGWDECVSELRRAGVQLPEGI